LEKTVILAEFTGWGAGLSDGWRGEGGKMLFCEGFAKKGGFGGLWGRLVVAAGVWWEF